MPAETRRVYGPYKDGAKWRVVFIRADGVRTARKYTTRAKALEVVNRYDKSKAVTVRQAIDDYIDTQSRKREWKRTTQVTTRHQLNAVLWPVIGARVDSVTPKRAETLIEEYAAGVAGDTALNTLKACKTWARWLVHTGRLSSSPFEKLALDRKRKRGKPQLRIDDARLLAEVCVKECSPQSIAVLTALVMGMRASEVCGLRVADLDDGGTILWIHEAKSKAGQRTLGVPEPLRPMLELLARDKGRRELLFPLTRYGLYYHTRRLCRAAGLDEVCPHSLRGLHSTVATVQDVPADAVARALGHSSFKVTRRHYLEADTVREAEAGKTATVLFPQPCEQKSDLASSTENQCEERDSNSHGC